MNRHELEDTMREVGGRAGLAAGSPVDDERIRKQDLDEARATARTELGPVRRRFGGTVENVIQRFHPGLETAALLAGRGIFGGYFLYNGVNHYLNREMLVEYARSKGVPVPAVAVAASSLLILAGGLSIVTGTRPKVGAGLISTFLLAVSPQMHAFWKEREPQQQMQEMVNFTKNMALVGASLLAAAHPEPWPWHVGTPGGALMAAPDS
jgi:putative oxidoreductase